MIDLNEPVLGTHQAVIDVPEGLEVVTDPELFQRIFLNVLTNAAKYSVQDAPIIVTARRNGSTASISIRDAGGGISDKQQKQIFEPFFRGGENSAPGVGLGLAIVQRAIAEAGGKIAVESVPGQGSTFTITLPTTTDRATRASV